MALWRSKKVDDSPQAEAEVTTQAESADGDPQGKAPASSGGGLLSKMKGALSKTRQTLSTDIRDLFKSEGTPGRRRISG